MAGRLIGRPSVKILILMIVVALSWLISANLYDYEWLTQENRSMSDLTAPTWSSCDFPSRDYSALDMISTGYRVNWPTAAGKIGIETIGKTVPTCLGEC